MSDEHAPPVETIIAVADAVVENANERAAAAEQTAAAIAEAALESVHTKHIERVAQEIREELKSVAQRSDQWETKLTTIETRLGELTIALAAQSTQLEPPPSPEVVVVADPENQTATSNIPVEPESPNAPAPEPEPAKPPRKRKTFL